MQLILIITTIILLGYLFLLVIFIYGWSKLQAPINDIAVDQQCSVLIAARNEANTLPLVISDLLAQSYNQHLLQIIVVNDHSTDSTLTQLDCFLTQANITILSLPDSMEGKKAALAYGAKHATAPVLAFVDADCRLPKHWLHSMMSQYKKGRQGMVCGPVQFTATKYSLWQTLLQIEFSFLVAAGAALAGVKRPIYCNGANLLVSAQLYAKATDYVTSRGASGDDVFLLHFAKQHSYPIQFCKSPQTIVTTAPPHTPSAFIQQRLRWASKSKRYSDGDSISVSIVVLAANVWMLVLLLLSLFSFVGWPIFALFFLLKTFLDLLFFLQFSSFFSQRKQWLLLPFIPLFYSSYVLTVSVAMLFYTPTWKGRMVS